MNVFAFSFSLGPVPRNGIMDHTVILYFICEVLSKLTILNGTETYWYGLKKKKSVQARTFELCDTAVRSRPL